VSLGYLGLENILQVPGNRRKVSQNYVPREAVSATFFSLKMKWGIFRPDCFIVSVENFFLCPFH